MTNSEIMSVITIVAFALTLLSTHILTRDLDSPMSSTSFKVSVGCSILSALVFVFSLVCDPYPYSLCSLDYENYDRVDNIHMQPKGLSIADSCLTLDSNYSLTPDKFRESEIVLSDVDNLEGLDSLEKILKDDKQYYNILNISVKEKDIPLIEYMKLGITRFFHHNKDISSLYQLDFTSTDNTGYLVYDGKISSEIRDSVTYYHMGDFTIVDRDNKLAYLVDRDNVHVELVYNKSTADNNILHNFKILNAR